MLMFNRMEVRKQLLHQRAIKGWISIAGDIDDRFGLQADAKFERRSCRIGAIGLPSCKEALLIQSLQKRLELLGA